MIRSIAPTPKMALCATLLLTVSLLQVAHAWSPSGAVCIVKKQVCCYKFHPCGYEHKKVKVQRRCDFKKYEIKCKHKCEKVPEKVEKKVCKKEYVVVGKKCKYVKKYIKKHDYHGDHTKKHDYRGDYTKQHDHHGKHGYYGKHHYKYVWVCKPKYAWKEMCHKEIVIKKKKVCKRVCKQVWKIVKAVCIKYKLLKYLKYCPKLECGELKVVKKAEAPKAYIGKRGIFVKYEDKKRIVLKKRDW